MRVPVRTLLASLGLFIGVTAFSILVAVDRAFQHVLVGTLLGHAVSLQIRPVDFLSIGLVLALAASSVADVLYLNIRDRAPELVTLRTSGWSALDLRRLVFVEALGISMLGSVTGAGLGQAVSTLLIKGVGATTALQGSAIGLLAGVGSAFVASLVPAARFSSLTPAVALSEE